MTAPPGARSTRSLLAWGLPTLVVAVLLGFVAGERVGTPAAGRAGGEPLVAGAPAAGTPAVDIAAMSPEERASRLYDRVMRYRENGQIDSARFFAPMAVKAYEMLGPPDLHAMYDVGMIYAVIGDSAGARSRAEAILRDHPTHLLGLVLAMRTASTDAIRHGFERRLIDASRAELASALPEYAEHRTDIDGAIQAARSDLK